MKKLKYLFLITFPILALLLVIIEIFFQVKNFPPPVSSGWKYNGKDQNQLGFRGQKIDYSEDEFVILLIGDSQVQASGSAVSLERMPEKLLQDYLNKLIKKPCIKVFSLGCDGYGQDQQLLALKEYFENFRANMVVLWFTPENDVWNNIFPTHWPTNGHAKPTYWLENGILHDPSEELGDIIFNERIKTYALLKRVLIKFKLINRPKVLLRDYEWESYLPPAYASKVLYDGEFSMLWQELWDDKKDISAFFKNENLTNEKTHFNMFLTPRSDRSQYGLDLTKLLLNKMKELTSLNYGKFVVFNFEIPERDASKRYNDGVYFLNGNYYEISSIQYSDNINYLMNDFRYLSIPLNMRDWSLGPRDAHLNDSANEVLMRELSKLLFEEITPNLDNLNILKNGGYQTWNY
jgi:hypothetical protein